MAASPETSLDDQAASHGFFVPMVDLLAGVVFLLVIMLAASVLVTRPDFGEAEAMQAEIQRISAELQAARAAERLLLDPRREAQAAQRLLIERLSARLRDGGYAVEAEPEAGRIAISRAEPFGGGLTLTKAGTRLADALAEALAAELPCVAAGTRSGDCAGYGAARIETVEIGASGSMAGIDASDRARALRMLSEIGSAQPALLALASDGGVPILTYGADSAAAENDVASSEEIRIRFQMRVPPIP